LFCLEMAMQLQKRFGSLNKNRFLLPLQTLKKYSRKNIIKCFLLIYNDNLRKNMPHGMCYSHFGNGAIFIMQWGFINDCYKVNPVGQWGKILVMAMGFVDQLGLCLFLVFLQVKSSPSLKIASPIRLL
jgi:hypothetical protein